MGYHRLAGDSCACFFYGILIFLAFAFWGGWARKGKEQTEKRFILLESKTPSWTLFCTVYIGSYQYVALFLCLSLVTRTRFFSWVGAWDSSDQASTSGIRNTKSRLGNYYILFSKHFHLGFGLVRRRETEKKKTMITRVILHLSIHLFKSSFTGGGLALEQRSGRHMHAWTDATWIHMGSWFFFWTDYLKNGI